MDEVKPTAAPADPVAPAKAAEKALNVAEKLAEDTPIRRKMIWFLLGWSTGLISAITGLVSEAGRIEIAKGLFELLTIIVVVYIVARSVRDGASVFGAVKALRGKDDTRPAP